MKYFIDTEFIEGKPTESTSWLMLKRRGGGLMFGLPKPTIDLISIGVVCEDGREYYAISKDFDLKEAWNRWQPKEHNLSMGITKEYWIRDNVLKPIYLDLAARNLVERGQGSPVPTSYENHIKFNEVILSSNDLIHLFTYKRLKKLIAKYGKSNEQISKEVIHFVIPSKEECNINDFDEYKEKYSNPKFYGYYSDYDWVAFCWLFGTMINLPKGFPMYCIDLKQESDRIYNLKKEEYIKGGGRNFINAMSNHLDYPKQTNEHNALADAKWNYKLYKFLNSI